MAVSYSFSSCHKGNTVLIMVLIILRSFLLTHIYVSLTMFLNIGFIIIQEWRGHHVDQEINDTEKILCYTHRAHTMEGHTGKHQEAEGTTWQ